MTDFIITFLPSHQTIPVKKGETVLSAALQAEITLNHVCGGNCSCTTCHVIIQDGFESLEKPSEDELERLSELGKKLSLRSRLACQTEIYTNMTVKIP